MELLRELLQINHDAEMSDLFEELGNLGKLGLGPMVNAFKQTYAVYHRKNGDKNTSKEGNKFSNQHRGIGKDSEAVDVGHVKNWAGLRREYKKHSDDHPVAAIFKVDDKPVALLIAAEYDTTSINDKVALAWDFSKLGVDEEEGKKLIAGLNTKGDSSWRTEIVGTDKKALASGRTDKEKERDYDFNVKDYVEKFTTKKYAGFTQTVREIVPFVNNLGATFGTRLTVALIMADKVRAEKNRARSANRPIDPKDLKLFKDDLSTRLAKYKNTKVDTAEDAADFVKKVFGGGLKKLKFAGRTYSAVPEKEYMGSSHSGRGKHEYFYNGTFATLLSGKPATMKFEADRKEGDYNTLYLTVKMVNGSLVPVEVRYSEKDGDSYGASKSVKF